MAETARQRAGELMRQRLRDAGMTQRQLGTLVGIGETEVSRYVRGTITPRVEMAFKLDEALKAGGELVSMWGHHTTKSAPKMDDLQRQIDELRDNLRVLKEFVEDFVQSAP